ncbi:MAG TPA: metalloregulator ArsR/SmtB family transcription factor [Solirubrobacteraceae bacterium]|nr:metalloregulator ArsR/SmtB family transcription factor [Solirubrobacteraceae bacterium]
MLNQQLSARPPLEPVFHALADPTRRAMIERLSAGPASVSELARPLSISLPGVVQHLRVLESSGLVRSRKVGRVRTCSIAPGALGEAEAWIAQRRRMWEERLDRLGEHLAASSSQAAHSDERQRGSAK